MRKINSFVKVSLFLLAFCGVVLFANTGRAHAAVDTCTWTGNGTNNLNNAASWTGCDNGNVPEPGDEIVFPDNATKKTLVNGIFGRSFSHVSVGSGYAITGNYIGVSGKNIGGINKYITFTGSDSTLGLDTLQMALNDNSYITFSGNNTISSAIATSGTGSLYIAGDTDNTALTISGSFGFSSHSIVTQGGGGSSVGRSVILTAASASASSSFTAGSGATLVVKNAAALGNTTGTTTVQSGGALEFDLAADTTFSENFNVAGNGIGGKGAIRRLGSSNITLSGNIIMTDDATFASVPAGANGLTLSGVISGAYSPTFRSDDLTNSSGKISLTGSSPNTYTGTTYIQSGGALYLQKANQTIAVPGNLTITGAQLAGSLAVFYNTGASNQIADNAVITLTNGAKQATLSAYDKTEIVGSVAGNGTVVIAGNGAGITLSGNTPGNFTGTVQFSGGTSTEVIKSGNGTWTIASGASLPVSADGKLTINNGDLVVLASLANARIEIGGTGTLKGTGSVGAVKALSGGTIAVGTSPGCMTFASLTLSSGSNYSQEINTDTACSGYDQATVTGAVDLGGATLNISQLSGFDPVVGTVFTIIDGASLTGTFNGLTDGAVFKVGNTKYRINYTASADVTLTVLPADVTPNATTPNSITNANGKNNAPNTGLWQKSTSVYSAVVIVGLVGCLVIVNRHLSLIRVGKK